MIYCSMLGVCGFAILQATDKVSSAQNRWLVALLTLLVTHIIGELYITAELFRYAPWLAGFQLPLRVLLGPALYFYAKATMTDEGKPSAKAWLLAMSGPTAVFMVMIPFLSLTAEQKLSLADPATRDPELFQLAVYACTTAMFLFVMFTIAYLIASLKLHARHRSLMMQRFSAMETRSLDWFRVVLFLWALSWFCYALDYGLSLMRWHWFGEGMVLPLLEAFVLVVFVHMALKQPSLNASEKVTEKESPKRTPSLSQSRMKEIATKLTEVMENDQIYMEEDLSLNKLSESIKESENHISETLSQFLHCNFFHFVNGFRIEAAKKMLVSSDKLVATIAYEVGFNNKSTFNAAFKKHNQTTPTSWRRQNQQA